MAVYRAGDRVHVAGFGKAVVREARNSGRYLVELKGRAMEVSASDLTPLDATRTRPRSRSPGGPGGPGDPGGPGGPGGPGRGGSLDPPGSVDDDTSSVVTLDLHGRTVDEALDLLERALNDALLAGVRELRVIHGRSGGRIKSAVHRRLGQVPSVQAFRVDPRNPGVTIVVF